MKTSFPFPLSLSRRVARAGLRLTLLLAVATAVVPPAHADETTRQVQEELRKRKLYFGDVDGRNTAQVAAALRRYQERKGFAATGQADMETLRSLNLRGPDETEPPQMAGTAASPGPTAPPAPDGTADTGAAKWPDITVLRSDEARATANRHPDENGIAGREVTEDPEAAALAHATPRATPAPPPASASAYRPGVDDVRAYLTRYLQVGATNDPDAEMRFYGEHVAYYDEGVVDRPYIARDVNRYDHRWPDRHFALLDPVTITESPDGDPSKFVVNFRYQFVVKNPRYAVVGKADNTWTLVGSRPGEWQIVSMKEQRVRDKQ